MQDLIFEGSVLNIYGESKNFENRSGGNRWEHQHLKTKWKKEPPLKETKKEQAERCSFAIISQEKNYIRFTQEALKKYRCLGTTLIDSYVIDVR